MTKDPKGVDLRKESSGHGKTLAVIGLPDGKVFEADPNVSYTRGVWDGESALALVESSIPPEREIYENDLKSLHEISFELSLCKNVDDLCREAVCFGLERLGVDRIGIWLVDQNDPRWKLGSWGTGEDGKLRDEHGWRVQRDLLSGPSAFNEGRTPVLVDEKAILRDQEGRIDRMGKNLIAPLWDGHSVIGELGVDDLLRHRGFSPEKREVIVIFARIVANLISLKRAEAELTHLASTDSLTGTVNRRTALIILEKNLAQCRRTHTPLTICLADLDGLKIVNDAHGHAAGDEYIRNASSALVGAVRGSDTVGRIGGDEFLIVFPDCRSDVVATILERVNAELAASAKGRDYVPRLSWGTASSSELDRVVDPDDPELQRTVDILLELADQRMYDNKRTKGVMRPRPAGEAELAF
jgi:diguanylate cyclase (GGDEF)-like protein